MYSASFTDVLFIPLHCRQHNTFHRLYGHGIPFPIGGGNVCIMGLHVIWLLHSTMYSKVFLIEIFACILIFCYSKLTLWIQEHCMQHSALFTGKQQVWGTLFTTWPHYCNQQKSLEQLANVNNSSDIMCLPGFHLLHHFQHQLCLPQLQQMPVHICHSTFFFLEVKLEVK